VAAGARQVECTINGLGERAGNAALEEVVMGLRTRRDFFRRLRTNIDTRKLVPASRLVSNLTGLRVQRNKAVVGENAFAHEAGIHQDGILKHEKTYEIMRPQDVGFTARQMVLGKHSGRHAFRQRLRAMGYALAPEQFEIAFERFKELADKKKAVYDADLAAIAESRLGEAPKVYAIDALHVTSGSNVIPTATVRLAHKGKVSQDAATGDGPVDAAAKAIERLTGRSGQLLDYQLRAVTRGKDAMGEVSVSVDFGGTTVHGRGVSTDIIEASAAAYLDAVNRAEARRLPRPPSAGAKKRKKAR
jgi:2-isopropylmalate synthase